MVDASSPLTKAELGALEKSLHTLLDAAQEAVLIVEPVGQVVFANSAALRMFGYERGELELCSIEGLLPQSRLVPTDARVDAPERPLRHVSRAACAVKKGGLEFPVDVISASVGGAEAPIVLAIVAARASAADFRNQASRAHPREGANEVVSQGVVIADIEGGYVIVSHWMAEMLRGPPEEFVGLGFEDVAFDRSAPEVRRMLAAPRRGMVWGDVELRRRDGSPLWCRYQAAPVLDAQGHHLATVALNTDITDSIQSRTPIASEKRYREFVEQMIDGLFVASANGRYIDVNAAGCAQFGMTREELLSCSLADLLSPEEQPRLPEQVAILASGSVVRNEWNFMRKDGTRFVGELSGRMLPDGSFQGVVRDVTQQKEAEQTIRDYQEKLKNMAFEAAVREDNERRRIASNLHDGAGQTLALAQMRLARARLGVGPPWRADLEACERLLEDADAQIRRVTFDLSPPVLYDLGLKPALEWLAEQMNELYGLSVEVGGDRDLDLEPATAAVAYRAVRELLTNVAKHGRVRDAKVKLRQEGASVKIVVEDHGIGIDTETSKRPDSFGLFSINEQVVRLHGTLDVQSTPTRGTTVTIVIPSGHPSGQRSRSS